MRLIDWNISYAGEISSKIRYLKSILTDESVLLLQEVKPTAYLALKAEFGSRFDLYYSLDYRRPGRFDREARKLGVLIAVKKGVPVTRAGVIERSPFPDRTMYVETDDDNQTLKLLALHSLTGVGYLATKSVQFDSFSEFLNDYQPDVIGIDANEPKQDHYDYNKMVFFDNGPGARGFFEEAANIGLKDAYILSHAEHAMMNGVPLATSHIVKGRGPVRYDHLFVRKEMKISKIGYHYEEAVAAGSDHALLICDIVRE